MSTRTFWAIFTVTIIVLVQWLAVRPSLGWLATQDIMNRSAVKYSDAFPSEKPADPTSATGQSTGTDNATTDTTQADKLAEYQEKLANFEQPVTKEQLEAHSYGERWMALYRLDKRRALQIAVTLGIVGILAGFLLASIGFRHLLNLGDRVNSLSTTDKFLALLGGLIGIFFSSVIIPLFLGNGRSQLTTGLAGVIVTVLFIWLLMNTKDVLEIYFPSLAKGREIDKAYQKPKILDTNVIIDGRVADVCAAGFLDGQIIVPTFVLEELQHIADSADSLRRARGRRGLDILNQMRKDLDLIVQQCDSVNPENPDEVDVRLVKLAQQIEACIVTNDFNLNKVAQVQGVTVLNINELANALKPVVLPGEELSVLIIKEGKEMNQGIAYLDDGTMIVIEGAKRHIGESADVTVTSVLQTVAGKMIFANLKSIQEEEDRIIDRNVRDYSSFRSRKKAY